MSINDRLGKENAAHIHHGTLCSHKKQCVYVLYSNVGESGKHHSQQTHTRAENQTLHGLTHRRVLNNQKTWAQVGEHDTLWSVGGTSGGTAWCG